MIPEEDVSESLAAILCGAACPKKREIVFRVHFLFLQVKREER